MKLGLSFVKSVTLMKRDSFTNNYHHDKTSSINENSSDCINPIQAMKFPKCEKKLFLRFNSFNKTHIKF